MYLGCNLLNITSNELELDRFQNSLANMLEKIAKKYAEIIQSLNKLINISITPKISSTNVNKSEISSYCIMT